MNIVLRALPLGAVSSDVTVGKQGKEESQRKTCDQVGNTTEQFLICKVLYLVRGHRKSVRILLRKESSKMFVSRSTKVYKTQNVGCTYFMDVYLIIFKKRIFAVMKFLLVVTEF